MTATSDRVVRTLVLLHVLLTTAMMTTGVKAGATNAEAPIAAVWHSRVVRFEYRARGTLPMCRTLQRKVERVLLELGARTRFTGFYCGELSHVVTAQFVLTVPIEATEQNLRRLTSFDSKDVLIARLRGQHLPAAADLPLFPAAWKTVALSGMRFDRGDCELLQQLRQQVLPKLSVGSSTTTCSSVPPSSQEMTLRVWSRRRWLPKATSASSKVTDVAPLVAVARSGERARTSRAPCPRIDSHSLCDRLCVRRWHDPSIASPFQRRDPDLHPNVLSPCADASC